MECNVCLSQTVKYRFSVLLHGRQQLCTQLLVNCRSQVRSNARTSSSQSVLWDVSAFAVIHTVDIETCSLQLRQAMYGISSTCRNIQTDILGFTRLLCTLHQDKFVGLKDLCLVFFLYSSARWCLPLVCPGY